MSVTPRVSNRNTTTHIDAERGSQQLHSGSQWNAGGSCKGEGTSPLVSAQFRASSLFSPLTYSWHPSLLRPFFPSHIPLIYATIPPPPGDYGPRNPDWKNAIAFPSGWVSRLWCMKTSKSDATDFWQILQGAVRRCTGKRHQPLGCWGVETKIGPLPKSITDHHCR